MGGAEKVLGGAWAGGLRLGAPGHGLLGRSGCGRNARRI